MPEAAMAKEFGTRLANDIVREAIHIHGAVGFARRVSESGESVRLEEMYRSGGHFRSYTGLTPRASETGNTSPLGPGDEPGRGSPARR